MRLHVPGGRVRRDRQPGPHAWTREPCVRATVPRHRGPLGIAAEAESGNVLAPGVLRELGRDRDVLHPELVAVVDGGCPAEREQEQHRRARRGRSDPARDTRLVMVAEHPVRPGAQRQGRLHRVDRPSHRLGRPGHVEQAEVERHVELVQIHAVVGDQVGRVEEVDLTDGDALARPAIAVQEAANVAVDAVRVRVPAVVEVEMRAVLPHVLVQDATPGRRRRVVAKVRVLHHRVRDVDAEPVHAAFEPEFERAEHRPAHLGVAPVEVRLLLEETVQVVLARPGIPGPGRPAEGR